MRQSVSRSGLRQIDAALQEVTTGLPDPGNLDRGNPGELFRWLILRGRRRELLAARWLVSQILPTTVRADYPQGVDGSPSSSQANSPFNSPNNSDISTPVRGRNPAANLDPPGSLITVGSSSLAPPPAPSMASLKSALLDNTVAKLQSGLVNQTGTPLEIDILRLNQKQELIYQVLRQFEQGLDELNFSQVVSDQLPAKCSALLRDIWANTTGDFFGKYATLFLGDRQIEIVPVLLDDEFIVSQAILDKIPLVPELITHLLFQTPLMVDNLACPAGSPEAMRQAEILLQNLVIRVASGVIQPLLDHFGDVEEIKQRFYDRRLLSTREIEKFRNNLSWYYRVEMLFGEPKAIFESSYRLFILGERGIQAETIYAPRNFELMQLNGIPLAVTLVLETRDAIAPRIQAALSLLGSGVIYLLTQVVGRGIGLIGRGILQGIGSSIQETQLRNQMRKKGDRRGG